MHLVGFIIKKFVTIYRHMNVKKNQEEHFPKEKKHSRVIVWENNSLAIFQVLTAVLLRIQVF